MEKPDAEELRCRIINQLRRSGSTTEVVHLWSGYLAALREWGLIDSKVYVALARLVGPIRDDELYQLFADAPMPDDMKSKLQAEKDPCS